MALVFGSTTPEEESRVSLQSSERPDLRVCIIGAGLGGVTTAVQLRKKGIDQVTLFEATHEIGGAWQQDAFLDPEATVAHKHVTSLVDEHDIRPLIQFGRTVSRVVWDESSHQYVVSLACGETFIFDVVVSAVGILNAPKIPAWKGLESFAGPIFHAANWDHSNHVAGKRVAVVGTGSTGSQLTIALAPQVAHLHVFQRDPGWMIPQTDEEAIWGDQTILRDSVANQKAQALASARIDSVLAGRPDLREAVTPTHPFLGKMPVRADGFYETLLRDNVTLVPHAVASISPSGVVDVEDELHEVDVVVLATGFKLADYLGDLDVFGRNGQSLQDRWAGEPDAFLGMSVPGFPNFYMVDGPNTFMGTETLQLSIQADYIAKDVKRMSRTGITSIEVRESFHAKYNDWLHDRLDKTVWATTDNPLQSPSGKLVVPFPGSVISYEAMARTMRRSSALARTLDRSASMDSLIEGLTQADLVSSGRR